MTRTESLLISHYDFDTSLFEKLENAHYANTLWPLVYILSDGRIKEAYIGETIDTFSRMQTHLKNEDKKKLSSMHLISSNKFNKSATLDIESNLIKYFAGDGQYQLLNGNLGLANHNYYQKKEVYWDIFKSIWNDLRSEGIARHSLEFIDNSDLFKYSPYKSLTKEQKDGFMGIIESLLNPNVKNTVIEGGAGTGKTILAIFLFKVLSCEIDDFNFKEFEEDESDFIELIYRLKTRFPEPKMRLVVPMASFRSTLKKVFKNIKGLSGKMVIGPAEVSKEDFDILVVDESHRLRKRTNLGAYYGAFDKVCEKLGLDKYNSSELDWILMKSKKSILFYDEDQSIKPSDTKKDDFDKLKSNSHTEVRRLKSQFRVKGGNAYVDHIDRLLNSNLKAEENFKVRNYDFCMFYSLEKMIEKVKLKNSESGLSRLIAGYSWQWVSNKNKDLYDISIQGIDLKWNGTSKDWINSDNSINEVGCIHTTQGYDLNYSGIIFGKEISYNKHKDEIVIIKENYFDKNGKQSITDPKELKNYIINIYKTILLRAIKGTYIYVCDPDLREYFSKYVPLANHVQIEKTDFEPEEPIPYQNCVPLYDLSVAAGEFGELQDVNHLEWIKVSEDTNISEDSFACKIVGESMNKIIPDNAIGLFRKDTGGSRNGKIVIVEHSDIRDDDFGSCYTIKEYHSKKTISTEGWEHQRIILKPLSYDSGYSELILENDELSSFRVIGIFEKIIKIKN